LWFPIGVFDRIVTDIFKQQPHGIGDRASDALLIAARLKPGITMAAAEGRLDPLARQLSEAYPATDRDRRFTLARLQRLGMSTRPQSDNPLSAVSAMLVL